jgi:hypothetical protein
MTARLSTGMANYLNKYGSVDGALRGGWIDIFSGSQPSSADAAPTGTLLTKVTSSSLALVNEVQAQGSLTLSSGTTGSIDTVTVNGVNVLGASVPFNGTLTQTALDLAAQINRYKSSPDYTAIANGNVVTLYASLGAAATPNGYVVATSGTGITVTTANLAGGVAGQNGLLFDNSVAGVLTKLSSQVWSGLNVAAGVAGWFRQHGPLADGGAVDSTGTVLRLDGAIATSGAEMNLNSTAFALNATTTLPNWQMTVPLQ